MFNSSAYFVVGLLELSLNYKISSRYDIAEILLRLMSITNQSINQSSYMYYCISVI